MDAVQPADPLRDMPIEALPYVVALLRRMASAAAAVRRDRLAAGEGRAGGDH